jgi:hypothetical protein
MIELGLKAEDKVTAFYGVVVARAEHLHGPDKYLLQPPCTPGSNVVLKPEWFEEDRVRILKDRTRG